MYDTQHRNILKHFIMKNSQLEQLQQQTHYWRPAVNSIHSKMYICSNRP